MRSLRCLAHLAFATVAALGANGRAHAQLQVVAPDGEPPAVALAELAYAEGEGVPITWLSLNAVRGPVAVVAALSLDAQVEAGLDAWLTALEVTASPNVLLPPLSTNCGRTNSFVHVAWPRSSGAEPTQLSLSTVADVTEALRQYGLPVPAEVPEAPRYVVWLWPDAAGVGTTRTLRVRGGSSPLPLLPSAAFPVVVSSVTRGAVALPTELSNQELSVTFRAREQPTVDYAERVRDWLAERPEPLLETRARGPLFDWSLHGDTVSLGSLVFAYASRAARELDSVDADACARQLRELRKAGAPAASACGDATDAELALSAAGPELPTLQRLVVSGALGFSPHEVMPGGEANPPLLRAKRLDDSACPVSALPLSPAPDVGPGGEVTGSNGTTTVVVEETIVVDEGAPAEVGCGASQPPPSDRYEGGDGCSSGPSSSESTSDGVDCSGDSSTSSDTDDSGCSSDTSSSSDTDDSGCSSDTSSTSSDTDDSGCSSDTSSTSSDTDDSGCSSDTSSSDGGYDGDTCTGSAAPGAERSQKTQASVSGARRGVRRPARLRTSLWAVAFVALVLPIRRRKGGRRGPH